MEIKKVEGKNRVIKRFVMYQKLCNIKKIFTYTHILQVCEYIDGDLIWVDLKFIQKPSLALFCDCQNNLIDSGSFISDNGDGVRYICTDCGCDTMWNFDLFPCPVDNTDGRYPTPDQMKRGLNV